ncbi:hypothetical protein [Virgibacillus chiguensis]|uniref:Uncharacterized protein n=1 Tax=Virgibacillus chiguensis TaxID=411959 RepID=A0A1M5WAV0_9BACI|nr:hypothetical protein [Virgibacillus chiguensis]SHH84353.1 hypothetical protein SAMN05421807_11577 [Virgibacillus chiguensis]
MKKKLITGALALSLFIGGTTTTSVFAGTDNIKNEKAVQTELATNKEVSPQATPAVAGAYALKGAGVAGAAFVGGVTAKAGADAYDWAKQQLGGSDEKMRGNAEYEDIKIVFDQ